MKRDLILLSFICLFFALWGGTPFAHPDLLLGRASEVLQGKIGYSFFHKPALIIYLNAAVYGLIFLFKNLLGASETIAQLAQVYIVKGNIASFPFKVSIFFPGHIITVCFSVLGSISTYLTAFRLTGKRITSLLAGLFLCTSLLWAADSRFITPDVPLASLCITTTLLTLLFVEKKEPLRLNHLIVLGLFFGLTTSAKYNGALIFSAIFLPMVFCYRKNYLKLLPHLFLIGIAGVIVFFIINPFIIIKFNMFVPQFMYQAGHAKVGHFGWKTDNGWVFHLTDSLRFGYGLLPVGLAIIGIAWIVLNKRINVAQKFAILTFPILFYLLMGKSRLAYQRYLLPMLPFLAVFSSLGVYQLYLLSNKFSRNSRALKYAVMLGLSIIVFVSIFPNVKNTITHNIILGRRDTREDFFKAISGSGLTSDLSIFCDIYTCTYVRGIDFKIPTKHRPHGYYRSPLHYDGREEDSNSRYYAYLVSRTTNTKQRIGRMHLGPDLAKNSPDIMIFDSFSHDRLIYATNENWNGYPEPYYSSGSYGFWAASLRQKYTNFENLYVVQISSFKTSKEKVPFSRKSVYSPYLPDLYYRKQPGPFIEIYCKDESVARKIADSCNRNNVEYFYLKGKDAYYFRKINEELNNYVVNYAL